MPCGTLVTYSQKAAKKMAVCSQHLSLITNICRLKRFSRMGGGRVLENKIFFLSVSKPHLFPLKESKNKYHIFTVGEEKRCFYKRYVFALRLNSPICETVLKCSNS